MQISTERRREHSGQSHPLRVMPSVALAWFDFSTSISTRRCREMIREADQTKTAGGRCPQCESRQPDRKLRYSPTRTRWPTSRNKGSSRTQRSNARRQRSCPPNLLCHPEFSRATKGSTWTQLLSRLYLLSITPTPTKRKRSWKQWREVLRDHGCETTLAPIEFTDPRYEKRFKQFPMPKPFLEVVAMIPAELGHKRAQIGIPDVVTERSYDFVVIGAPTWWLSTDVPIREFLESETATKVLEETLPESCCRRYGSTT